MEQMMQRERTKRRERRRRNLFGETDSAPEGRKEKVLYYTAVFLRVALWLAIEWALLHVRMRAPCFLLAVLMWAYFGPLKALFSRAIKRQDPDRNRGQTQ